MESAVQVQILDEAVRILHFTNALRDDINPTLFLQAK